MEVERVLDKIIKEVELRIDEENLSLEDLNMACLVLLNAKEREKMENPTMASNGR